LTVIQNLKVPDGGWMPCWKILFWPYLSSRFSYLCEILSKDAESNQDYSKLKQESRAAARKLRGATAAPFGLSSPTTFITSISVDH